MNAATFIFLMTNTLTLGPPNPNIPGNYWDSELQSISLTLDPIQPPHFVLIYPGPYRISFDGVICYQILGYNESCIKTDHQFLTRTTRVRLLAPGGVPIDVLQGYDLIVHFPALTTNKFNYSLDRQSIRAGK